MRPDANDAKDDAAAIWDMLEAAKDIVGFVKGRTLDEYGQDRMLQAAIERASYPLLQRDP